MTEADAAAGGGAISKEKQQQPPLSKRQRRKHVNPSNTWPQQPKIQSQSARAKANLRVAGLLVSPPSSSLDPTLDLHSPEVKFGRLLGAPEQRKRHLAITSLQSYLKQRCDIHSSHGISELDLLKLWKALWYTLFLADKVPVQQEVSSRLAKLVWCVAGTEEEDEYAAQMYVNMCDQADDEDDDDVVMEEVVNTLNKRSGSTEEEESEEDSSSDDDEQPFQEPQDVPDELVEHCRGAHLAALFCKTFFQTMQREWGNIDKHRIDKFYTLVRLFLREIFSYMASRHWNRGIISLFNDVIRDEVLFQVPNGLRCHLIDITVEELAKANATAPMPLTEATFLDCIDPYMALAQFSDDSMVHARVMENLFGKFLDEYSIVHTQENDHVMDQVHVGTIAKFLFALGSDADTEERHRKRLYDMHKKYMKRLKQTGKDVELEVESPDEGQDGADDVEEEDKTMEKGAKPKKRKRKAAKPVDEASGDGEATKETPAEESKLAHNKKRKKSLRDATLKEGQTEKSKLAHNKKRKKTKRDATPKEGQTEESKLAHNKKRKKSKHDTTNHDTAQAENESREEKKKKRKSSISSDDGSLDSKDEEVITISCAEQKKAAKDIAEQDETVSSSKKKKMKSKSTPTKAPKSQELTSEEKRVKFGRVNHSKSYKASMKALKTVKHTPNKTPDHGILRTKIASPPLSDKSKKSAKKKGARKRATDYF